MLKELKRCLLEIIDYLNSAALIIGWFILIISIIPMIIVGLTNAFFGDTIKASVVIGTSEFPKLTPGDIIFILKTKNLDVGDIGCYIIPSDKCSPNLYIARKGEGVCHDVVNKEVTKREVYYEFKGCANPTKDPCKIPDDFVEGKVIFRIPLIGIGVVPLQIFFKVLIHLMMGGYI